MSVRPLQTGAAMMALPTNHASRDYGHFRMSDLRKAAQMALEALERERSGCEVVENAIDALRAALEQPTKVVECMCGLCKLERL